MAFPSPELAYGLWNLNDISNANYSWPYDFVDITVYGAGGGGGTPGGWSFGAPGGAGGYSFGKILLPKILPITRTFYVVVGSAGLINQTSYLQGGGGTSDRQRESGTDVRYGGGGGGFSGVFLNQTMTQQSALIIAGGGGGGGSSRAGIGNSGGSGGGLIGENGSSPYDSKILYAGKGGSQTAAGVNASCDSQQDTNGFQRQFLGGSCLINNYGGAGGGGYWGGSAGGYSESNTMAGGGGGSGYLNLNLLLSAQTNSGFGNAGGNASQNGTNGTVIFRYKGSRVRAFTTNGGTTSYASDSDYTFHTFTSSQSNLFNELIYTSITFNS